MTILAFTILDKNLMGQINVIMFFFINNKGGINLLFLQNMLSNIFCLKISVKEEVIIMIDSIYRKMVTSIQ